MPALRTLLPLVALSSLLSAASASSHPCASVLGVDKVPGTPGLVHIRTTNRVIGAWEPPSSRATVIAYVVRALDVTYDSDGNAATIVDTLVAPVGSTVRFKWITGSHTLTEGLNSGDLGTARFNYILDPTHQAFDTTLAAVGTMNYFCRVHELPDRNQSMAGTIIITSGLDVPGAARPTRVTFSRPPAPNPSRSTVSFAITLPAERQTEVTVHDIGGREVAVVTRGLLGPGEHAYQWDGRSSSGQRLAAGRYILRLRAGSVTEVRAFSLIR